MNPAQLRTKTEKVLYPIALIFSGLVWLGLLAAIAWPLLQKPAPVAEPCIYEEMDEEDTTIYYNYTSPELKELYQYPESCLDNATVSPDIYQEAKEWMEGQDKKSGGAAAGGVGIVLGYAAIFIMFIYVMNAMAMAFIRLNGIRISPTQYPAFYKIYAETAKALGLQKIPNAYVIQAGGELNAFAIKITRRRMVVFFADLIEAMVEGGKWEELRAIAAHELTHVKLKHINYWIFLMPFMILPFLGRWLSRAREYSADRGAYFVCQDKKVVSQALVKLVAGKFVAKEINVAEFMDQPKTERGFFTWAMKMSSTHPPIPHRIRAINEMGPIKN